MGFRSSLLAVTTAIFVAASSAPALAAAPVANDDTLVVTRGESGTASGTVNVLSNDTDPDGDALSVTTTSTSSTEGGEVGCTSDGECTYTEPGGPCGYADTFRYTVSDGTSTSDGTVDVTVECDDGGGGGGAFIERELTLVLGRHLVARGMLGAGEAFNCVAGMVVRVQKRVTGSWRTIKTLTTDNTGAYRGHIPDAAGRYRAKSPEIETESPPDTCGAATSSPRVHRH